MLNRVCCLYRVSTKKQMEKDDIPMQYQTCHEFSDGQGWNIVEEKYEKGVSGFKVSAKDRDVIQEIQKDALLKKFDILLVFMFDRLGRRDDETPFVVEWFVSHGIRVWSAMEGEQRFDTHVDKLMNYIRYWQASGESIKTSIRTRTRLGQIVQEGHFRGGVAPLGYQLVKKGRMGKKNKELYDLEINEAEATIIRQAFGLCVKYGLGGRRLSTELEKLGSFNRNGKPLHYSSIQNILRNIMYTGILRSGESQSEVIPELQIIDMATFERVREICEQRSRNYEGFRNTPRKVSGKALLSGNVYCGHCGGRIFASTAKRGPEPKNENEVRQHVPIYKCYNRTQHHDTCDGPTTYTASKVDTVVKKCLTNLFSHLKSEDESELIDTQYTYQIKAYHTRLAAAKEERAKTQLERDKMDALMLSAIEGTCVFSAKDLTRRLQVLNTKLDSLEQEISMVEMDVEKSHALLDGIKKEHEQLKSWADIFETASPDIQKMIASALIERVEISRDYHIDITLALTEEQYNGGMIMAM